jgi:hypothetical protein
MKYSTFVMVAFFLLSCTPEDNKLAPEKVLVETDARIISDSDNIETLYSVSEGTCRVLWQIFSMEEDKNHRVQLRNRSECNRPFGEVIHLHNKVIERILQDYSPATINEIVTGGLSSLQPDKSWSSAVAVAAQTSADYQDYRQNYPEHSSKKSINQIFIDLVHETQVHAQFKQMLSSHGLNFELNHVEKVFNEKALNGETVISDAGVLWWKPKEKTN